MSDEDFSLPRKYDDPLRQSAYEAVIKEKLSRIQEKAADTAKPVSGLAVFLRPELSRWRRYASRTCLITFAFVMVVSCTRWSKFTWIPAVIVVVSALLIGTFLLGELLYGAGLEKQMEYKKGDEFYRLFTFQPSITSPIALFILLGIVVFGVVVGYAEIYLCLSQLQVIAFSKSLDVVSALYFSFITFATVGYGDFYPCDNKGRLLVTSEVAVAMFVILVVLAISISWILSHRQELISARNEERNRTMQAHEEAMKEVKFGLYSDEADMNASLAAKMEELRQAHQKDSE